MATDASADPSGTIQRMLIALLAAATASAPAAAIVGQPAPGFDLASDHGGHVKLSDYRGRKVVLAFFPKAFTGG